MDEAPPDLLAFVKMHGCQNDYVVIADEDIGDRDLAQLAVDMCARRTGIGADGLLMLSQSTRADLRMRMFNPDGSEAEMCGNGLRCAARFAWEFDLVSEFYDGPLRIETGAGLHTATRLDETQVTVSMGVPVLTRKDIPMEGGASSAVDVELRLEDRALRITAVSMGNPHTVAFVKNVTEFPLADVGPRIEHHAWFPNRTNVEVAEVLSPKHIMQRTWERGAGETHACGTGACAVAVAGVLTDRTDHDVTIDLPGGTLHVSWKGEGHEVFLTGPTEVIFAGAWGS